MAFTEGNRYLGHSFAQIMNFLLLLSISCGVIYIILQALFAYAWWMVPNVQNEALDLRFSIIVAARNEAANLQKLLPILLEQRYEAGYEVIIVLDRCSDASEEILDTYSRIHDHLRKIVIYELPANWTGKKWAIQQGVQQAQYEHLVFTDADCLPTRHWLSSYSKHFQAETELVLGLGPYQREVGLLNLFIQFETAYTAFQYIGLAQLGLPYMGVGRNMGYTKAFFQRAGGLDAIATRLSGDDDLLVNAHADPTTTSLMILPESRTISVPSSSWKSWFRQKLRHNSAAPAYSWKSKLALFLFHGTHTGFFITILASSFFCLTKWPFFTLYLLRLGISWIIFFLVNRRMKLGCIWWVYPVLDFMYFIYNLIVVPFGIIVKPQWKK